MADHLARATYRVLHSLRRRAAGEHTVEVEELIVAFGSEWNLNALSMSRLRLSALRYQTELNSSLTRTRESE